MKIQPGNSENNRIHSLKSAFNKRDLSCVNIAIPIQSGNDEPPSKSISHKWKILFNGNTSK